MVDLYRNENFEASIISFTNKGEVDEEKEDVV